MIMPSLNTSILLGADFDSDSEEKPFLRKCKSEPNKQRWSKEGIGDALQLEQMYTINTFSGPDLNTIRTLDTLELHPSVCNEDCTLEAVDKRTSLPVGNIGDNARIIDSHQGLSVNMIEMLGKVESLPSVGNGGPMHLKSIFVDVDSDFDEEPFVRKCKSEPQKRRWSKKGAMGTLQLDKMNTFDTLSGLEANPTQTLGSLESLPSACKDACKLEAMDKWKNFPIEKIGDKARTIDSNRGLSANMTEMLGKVESLQSVRNGEYKRELFDRVYLKNTFIDVDYILEPEYELPMRRTYLSYPGPAKKCIDENVVLEKYGATLLSRTARLGEMLQPAFAKQDAQKGSSHTSIVVCDATILQESLSNSMVSTEPDGLGHIDDTRVSISSLDAFTDQAQVQPAYLTQAVTTLVVCNLPRKLSSEGLANAVDELGFEGWYDLVYVPRGATHFLGYGFINFIEPQFAARFSAIIGTYTFPGNSKKQPYCKVSHCQGMAGCLKLIQRGQNYRRRAQVPVIGC